MKQQNFIRQGLSTNQLFKVCSLVQALSVSKELKHRGIFSKICYNTWHSSLSYVVTSYYLRNAKLAQFQTCAIL